MMLQAPFTHLGVRIPQMMRYVLYALAPAWLFSIYLFGPQALMLSAGCVIAAVVTEWLCHKINSNCQGSLGDGSAIVTAIILAMSLPPHAPVWMGALGSALGIAFGKQCYGGLGQNLFNPAMFARVVLLIAFPVEMTHWPEPSLHSWHMMGADAITAATPLAHETGYHIVKLTKLLLGDTAGSMGETSIVALVIGGAYLFYKRVIEYPLVVSSLLGCMIPATLMYLFSPAHNLPPLQQLTSGALVFAAIFIVTDPVTAPSSRLGQWIYGGTFGLLVWLIRQFANYPEGVAFAILLCNGINPLIEHYTRPVIYGHNTERRKS
ncbi:RnfABCDGE type electron transport complex subunit D [Celerinatantimonas sp. MCCC 1A17872]|uniref:RnfABCDGE type electron transport complex subunit D n=1 Tax=Celerinatantimonas sp. MCCC 1A17872 TaxID=3177514 RepID=UPI0038BF33A0